MQDGNSDRGQDGLICAVVFDGRGGGTELGWDGVNRWQPGDGFLWMHMDRSNERGRRWMESHIPEEEVLRALLAEETRPRSVPHGEQLLVTLRGVNLNPGEDPEDMVSLRLWIGPQRIVSTLRRRVFAATDLRESLAAGTGPRDSGDFLGAIAERMIGRMGPTLDDLNDAMDAIEDNVLEEVPGIKNLQDTEPELRRKLVRVRQQVIALRRYLAPQRDALARLQMEQLAWLKPEHRLTLREAADHTTRYVEDLDALRDRGTVIQDELRNRLSENMNRTMYVLTLVAAILLPLGFLTGLLGINVDGIPGSEDAPLAFPIVVAGLGAVAALQIWLFRRLKWL